MWLQTKVPAVFETAAGSPALRIAATQALIGRVAKCAAGPSFTTGLSIGWLAVIVADARVLDVDRHPLEAKLGAAARLAHAQHDLGPRLLDRRPQHVGGAGIGGRQLGGVHDHAADPLPELADRQRRRIDLVAAERLEARDQCLQGARSTCWPRRRARRAITPTRWARYSALPWMSLFSPSAGILMSLIAAEEKFLASASSIALTRNTLGPGAGHRDPHAARRLGHEHADHGVARGRIGELHVGGLLGLGEADRGDQLALAQRRLEQALEEAVGGVLAGVGGDGGVERHDRRRIVRRRIVVGDRAADRAAIAHLRIADMAGEIGQRRDGRSSTSAEVATSAWRVMPPITTLLPSTLMPASSLMPPRSTTSLGLARRCFSVGIRVMPPDMARPSALPLSRPTASASDFGR